MTIISGFLLWVAFFDKLFTQYVGFNKSKMYSTYKHIQLNCKNAKDSLCPLSIISCMILWFSPFYQGCKTSFVCIVLLILYWERLLYIKYYWISNIYTDTIQTVELQNFQKHKFSRRDFFWHRNRSTSQDLKFQYGDKTTSIRNLA